MLEIFPAEDQNRILADLEQFGPPSRFLYTPGQFVDGLHSPLSNYTLVGICRETCFGGERMEEERLVLVLHTGDEVCISHGAPRQDEVRQVSLIGSFSNESLTFTNGRIQDVSLLGRMMTAKVEAADRWSASQYVDVVSRHCVHVFAFHIHARIHSRFDFDWSIRKRSEQDAGAPRPAHTIQAVPKDHALMEVRRKIIL